MKFAVRLLNPGAYIHCQVCNLMHDHKQGGTRTKYLNVPSPVITRNTITLSCGNKEFNLVDCIGKIVFTQNICAMMQFSIFLQFACRSRHWNNVITKQAHYKIDFRRCSLKHSLPRFYNHGFYAGWCHAIKSVARPCSFFLVYTNNLVENQKGVWVTTF